MSWTSPLTALSHLSDEAVAAFADGVLSEPARHRAQSHMAECGECSSAVYGQRAARAALRAASSPSLPAGLFERLRELPITTELPAVHLPSALSVSGEPLFAPTDAGTSVAPVDAVAAVRPRAAATTSTVALTTPSRDHAHRGYPAAGTTAGHRRTSTRVGLGATAAALVAVGVLATTAANAGGVAPPSRTVRPAGDSHNATAAETGHGGFGPAGSARSSVQMTLLSVPASGR